MSQCGLSLISPTRHPLIPVQARAANVRARRERHVRIKPLPDDIKHTAPVMGPGNFRVQQVAADRLMTQPPARFAQYPGKFVTD
jgi:hypothetical protein